MKERLRIEWQDMEDAWRDDPQQAANHLAMGMSLKQRQKARMEPSKKGYYTWV